LRGFSKVDIILAFVPFDNYVRGAERIGEAGPWTWGGGLKSTADVSRCLTL
jgi:hypothetical protein